VKIYTKTGDAGETGLVGGCRIPKTSLRIIAIGEVDELNAAIGLCRSEVELPLLSSIQNWLFDLGSELASPGQDRFHTIGQGETSILEESIDEMESRLSPLTNFILPGGSEGSSRLHLARSICRRAERAVLALAAEEPLRGIVTVFLNRLSDWLFVAARTANALSNVMDVEWKRGS
jgi:cob(I)alamin adenosyltransferase